LGALVDARTPAGRVGVTHCRRRGTQGAGRCCRGRQAGPRPHGLSSGSSSNRSGMRALTQPGEVQALVVLPSRRLELGVGNAPSEPNRPAPAFGWRRARNPQVGVPGGRVEPDEPQALHAGSSSQALGVAGGRSPNAAPSSSAPAGSLPSRRMIAWAQVSGPQHDVAVLGCLCSS
jgi:hypothetical protein